MKKLFLSLLLALSAMTSFIACKDEEDDTPKAKTIVELAQGDAKLST